MKLEDLREVCKTKNVALADPNIPTFCGYIGMDRKGRKRAQGREIQLVGGDKKKGWGLLSISFNPSTSVILRFSNYTPWQEFSPFVSRPISM